MDAPTETWQVEVDGAHYEADTETLTQWILDGYVTRSTKVKKGSLQWIEIGRVPAFRTIFASSDVTAPSYPAAPEPTAPAAATPAYGFPAADVSGAAFAPAPVPVATDVCVNHPGTAAKYMCQSCGAALCIPCVKRYGTAAVCGLCGQLCKPFGEAQATIRRTVDRYSGYGAKDFAASLVYPFKDPIAFALTALLYGVLALIGTYGKAAAAGLLFASMSYAIRRVAMGHYEEGPSPDLSDPGEWIFDSIKLGIAVTLVTFGPLIAVVVGGIGFGGFEDLAGLATMGAGVLLALAWALFYYPMALLVAGYTADFLSIINPLVGLSTMRRMGLVYLKAYAMCVVIFLIQIVVTQTLDSIYAASETLTSVLIQGFLFLGISAVKGAIWFYASMVMACVLGLAIYKKADELEVYIAQ